jgi:hypothetical protein
MEPQEKKSETHRPQTCALFAVERTAKRLLDCMRQNPVDRLVFCCILLLAGVDSDVEADDSTAPCHYVHLDTTQC